MTLVAQGSLAPLIPVVAITVAFLIGVPIFAYKYRRAGKPKTDRIVKAGGSVLLGPFLMEYGYWFLSGPTKLFVWLGITPDQLSYLGLGVVVSGAVATGYGHFGLGGWLMLFGAMLDAIDGMVARQTGVSSDAGEFLDAMIDRYAEIAAFVGLCFYWNNRPWAMGAALGGLLGSLMLSYGRAKAESLGINDAPSGLMRRHERALYLGLGIALAPVLAVVLEPGVIDPVYHLAVFASTLIALLANVSAFRMLVFVKRALATAAARGPGAAGTAEKSVLSDRTERADKPEKNDQPTGAPVLSQP